LAKVGCAFLERFWLGGPLAQSVLVTALAEREATGRVAWHVILHEADLLDVSPDIAGAAAGRFRFTIRDDGDPMRANAFDHAGQARCSAFCSSARAKGPWKTWVRHRYPLASDGELDDAAKLGSAVVLRMADLIARHRGRSDGYPRDAMRVLKDTIA